MDNASISAFSEAMSILYAPATPAEFPARVHQAFARLFPATCVSYDEFNVRTGVSLNSIDRKFPLPDSELLERWSSVAPHHPGVVYYREGGKKSSLAVSDLVSQRALRDGILYQDFWKHVGVRDQLFATMPVGENMIGVAVNNDAVYTAEQTFLMELAQPHFAQAYRNVRLLAAAQASTAATGELDFTRWRSAGLTRRECEVMRWLMEGKRNSEIAVILGASPHTIRTHVQHIMEKLCVETRTAAAATAAGLLRDDSGFSMA